jgi:ABC-type bacteriocin/lantibiotic exporter with double-glycine peptidase domain
MSLTDPPLVPICRQELDYSCTAAALRAVLSYLGADYPEAELRARIGITATGSNIYRMALAARALGYPTTVRHCDRDHYGPALARLGQLANHGRMPITSVESWTIPGAHHILVVGAVTTLGVLSMDPKLGYRFCPHPEWRAHWHNARGERVVVCVRAPTPAPEDSA